LIGWRIRSLSFQYAQKRKAASGLDSGRQQAQHNYPDSRIRLLAALRLDFDTGHHHSNKTKNLRR